MEGSGQFLLLDDALRVKGRCTKRLCEHPGAGEQWVCIGSMGPKKINSCIESTHHKSLDLM